MKDEYDVSKAERGRFYRPGAQLITPTRDLARRPPCGRGWSVIRHFARPCSRKPCRRCWRATRPAAARCWRDYINATIGFEALAALTHTPAKSLMRMFGPKGNPSRWPGCSV